MQERLVVWSRFLGTEPRIQAHQSNPRMVWCLYTYVKEENGCLRLHTCSSIRWSRNCCSQCISNYWIRQAQWWSRKVISEFLCSKDVLVILPTEDGKSLCLATLSLIFDCIKYDYLDSCTQRSTVVIISPLVSLMKDQVRIYSEKLCAYRRGTERLVFKALSTKHRVPNFAC